MARLLRDLDYNRLIQDDNLLQVIESNQQTKLDIEQSAQAEMTSYLAPRYEVANVFTNTTVFSISAVYKGKNLVEFTADTYASTSTYSINTFVVYSGYVYKANQSAITGAWDATKWTQICLDKALFYVTLPYPEYDAETTYSAGDIVWYKDKTYTCLQPCLNVLPTVSQIWGTGTEYTITGVYPDDSTKWTTGDNRNQQIVLFLIDITLYHLHSRINPRNIPDLRKERYNGNDPMDRGGAIGWLKSVAHGNVQADLPVIVPQQGLSMRSGNAGTYDQPSKNMMW